MSLDAGTALVVWVADLLQRCPLEDVDQRWLVLEEMLPHIRAFGNHLSQAIQERPANGMLPVAEIGFGDRAYAVFTGHEGVLELATGQWVSGVRKQFFERVVYNLTVLFVRRHQAYQPRTEPDAEPTPTR